MRKRVDVNSQEQLARGIEISVNGETLQSRAGTLAALLEERGYGDAKVATAVNGEFVAASMRDETAVRSGDLIEIVAPRQGG